jgi:hypothetical protein
MKHYVFNIVFLILLVSCVSKPNERAVVSLSTNELDIINHIMETINQENKIVVINENLEITYPNENYSRGKTFGWLRKTRNVDNDLLKSFEKNNNKQMVLEWNIAFGFDFVWNREYKNNNEPLKYYGKITFSKVGFNKE